MNAGIVVLRDLPLDVAGFNMDSSALEFFGIITFLFTFIFIFNHASKVTNKFINSNDL